MFFVLQKNSILGSCGMEDLNGEKTIGTFHEIKLKSLESKIEKVINKSILSYILNGKAMMICLISG